MCESLGAKPSLAEMESLADSGVGKDFPRKVNKRLADRVDLSNNVADQFGSGEGIEDSLYQYPTMLFQTDEFDTILNSMKVMRSPNSPMSANEVFKLNRTIAPHTPTHM